MSELVLTGQESILRIRPDLGGAVTAFHWRETPILRPALSGVSEATQASMFVMAPFANRIADGRFSIGFRNIALALNVPPHPHALHGHGWQTTWRVDYADAG